MTGDEWRQCLDHVLFPLLDRLLEPSPPTEAVIKEEIRMRACTLLCKVIVIA
jgi:hypothetical protein